LKKSTQKHQYLTKEVNQFIELVSSISDSCDGKKNGNSQKNLENSRPVAEMGVEPSPPQGDMNPFTFNCDSILFQIQSVPFAPFNCFSLEHSLHHSHVALPCGCHITRNFICSPNSPRCNSCRKPFSTSILIDTMKKTFKPISMPVVGIPTRVQQHLTPRIKSS